MGMMNQHQNPEPSNPNQNENSLHRLSRTLKMSEGQFSLILARCNYVHLQQEMVQQLHQRVPVPIREFFLPPNIKTLYSAIVSEMKDKDSRALMVFDLEKIPSIDQVLIAANNMREEFRNTFKFPLVLWVNDTILKKLMRLVTDIESWTTSVEFILSPASLINFLETKTEALLGALLERGVWRQTNSEILGEEICQEIESAMQDLPKFNVTLPPCLEAKVLFLRGRDQAACHNFEIAIKNYQQSLQICQEYRQNYPHQNHTLSFLFEGLVLFCIGLCYRRIGEGKRTENQSDWRQAQQYYQQSLQIFAEENREDLVAQYINQLGEILVLLQDWDQLWDVAVKGRSLHQNRGESSQFDLAQSYGFLAAVALDKKELENAKEWSTIALEILDNITISETSRPIYRQKKALYLLVLAQAEEKLGMRSQAIKHLELSHENSQSHYYPRLYLHILDKLRQLYFDEKDYRSAFQIKQEYRSTEHIYGFRAFLGAGRLQPHQEIINTSLDSTDANISISDEIRASGRLNDVHRLIERISSTQYKLTIIYGQSGVGKSSILTAGLVPALKDKIIENRVVFPVILQVYQDWIRDLKRQLTIIHNNNNNKYPSSMESPEIIESGEEEKNIPELISNSLASLSPANLRSVEIRQMLELLEQRSAEKTFVLIFDQFEEFFFAWKQNQERKPFFDFLNQCLNIPYLKIIFSIREDRLHYLLEFNRSQLSSKAFDNGIIGDILGKDILFYLGNFTPEDTYKIIESLTQRSQFYLEQKLIEQLVKDLAGTGGEIRPIELQMIGAQLQEENITTLEKYQKLGENPQQKLVERFLEEVIKDCGDENKFAARLVLYSLTDEEENRPLKTRAELTKDLDKWQQAPQLDLVLEILVKSGLVFLWTEDPTELYQLAHDYLVTFIRQQQEQWERENIEKLRQDNAENILVIAQLLEQKKLQEQVIKAKEKQQKAEKRLKLFAIGGATIAMGGAIVMSFLAIYAFDQRQKAEDAKIKTLDSGSDALVKSPERNPLESLGISIQLGGESEKTNLTPDRREKIAQRLRYAVASIQELNRVPGDNKRVLTVSVNPQKDIIASADQNVHFWNKNGKEILLKEPDNFKHKGTIFSVTFSPDGQLLATGADDNKVRIWNIKTGKALILDDHKDYVTRVAFSPDGKTLASASGDQTIKIWRVADGKLLKTLKEHTDWVLGLSFHPNNSNLLASSSMDGTIKLWTLDGSKLTKNQIVPNKPWIYSVAFSPDGNTIASASQDNTIKLWDIEKLGQEDNPKTLKGHNDEVIDVSYSPDGNTLVSASADDTLKIWSKNGVLLMTLRGHEDDVRSVTIAADGMIISGSLDKTVRFWRTQKTPLTTILAGHGDWVYWVSFRSDNKIIASASNDETVKLWKPDGTLLNTLSTHSGAVSAVSFAPKGNLLASGSHDKTVKLWTLEDKDKGVNVINEQTLQGHTGTIFGLSFRPDGEVLASASDDQTIKLWQVKNGNNLQTLSGHKDEVSSVNFNPKDGNILVSGSKDKSIKIWKNDGKQMKEYNNIKLDFPVTAVVFHPEGQFFASVSDDNKVRFWDIEGRLLFPPLDAHQEKISSLSFSPDGKYMVTASNDQTVKLWEVNGKTVTVKKTLIGYFQVFNVTFSRDSKMFALANRDKVVLWPLDNLELETIVDKSCEWIKNYWRSNHLEDKNSDRTRYCANLKKENKN
jgi:WD40 repeat protein/tetratricopeptide (TPR) repeat protein